MRDDVKLGVVLDDPSEAIERISGSDGEQRMAKAFDALNKRLDEMEAREVAQQSKLDDISAQLAKASEHLRIERMTFDERVAEVKRVRGC
jgi:hypothetical protein